MRLVIQIPCLNEAATLPQTLSELPREVPGFDEVLWVVVDDGSTDQTSQVAWELGVDEVVRFPANRGLARAFEAGIDASLRLGADVIVNTDADNQYRAEDIPRLVEPVRTRVADIAIGDRGASEHPGFSPVKRWLQGAGSAVVRRASGTDVPDAPSGFRAYSREAAMNLLVMSDFSYTLETIIRAGKSRLTIADVPITTNVVERPSRLFRSKRSYVRISALNIVRTWAEYSPFKFFAAGAAVFGLVGLILFGRFGVIALWGDGPDGHVQSLLAGVAAIVVGFQFLALAIVADLIRTNRMLIERVHLRVREIQFGNGSYGSDRDRDTGSSTTGARPTESP